jgi:acyl carrier protein
MSMAESTFERVKRVCVEELGVDPEKVVPAANFMDDLGADSVDLVSVAFGLEEEFDIAIPDKAIDKLRTVQDAIQLVERLLASKSVA